MEGEGIIGKRIEIVVRIQDENVEKEISVFNMELSLNETSSYKRSILIWGNLKIDSIKRRVWIKNWEAQLTAKEFELLFFLARHPGQVFSHNQIYNAIYEMTEGTEGIDNIIYCLVRNLRRKIEIDLKEPPYIHTVRGVGYKFETLSKD